MIEAIQSTFADHNGFKLGINIRKKKVQEIPKYFNTEQHSSGEEMDQGKNKIQLENNLN